MTGRLVSTALWITAANWTGRLRSSSLPQVMRLTSIQESSTSRTYWVNCRSIIVIGLFGGLPLVIRQAAMSSSPLRSGASGLRSSCAGVARNSSLRRSASEQVYGQLPQVDPRAGGACVMSRLTVANPIRTPVQVDQRDDLEQHPQRARLEVAKPHLHMAVAHRGPTAKTCPRFRLDLREEIILDHGAAGLLQIVQSDHLNPAGLT